MTTTWVEARPRPVTIIFVPAATKDSLNDSIDDIAQGRPDVSSLLAFKKKCRALLHYNSVQRLNSSRRPRLSTVASGPHHTTAIPPNTTASVPAISRTQPRELTLPESPENLPVVAEGSVVEISTSQSGEPLPAEVPIDVTLPETEITTTPIQTRMVVPEFDQIDKGLFQAVRVAVPRIYLSKWEESWKDIITARVVKLGLGNSILGLNLCMVGENTSLHGVEATIVVYCESANKKTIIKDLAPFVKSYVKPPPVGIRVIAEDVMFSSGDSMNSSALVLPEISRMVVILAGSGPGFFNKTQSIMGIPMQVAELIQDSTSYTKHPLCTIGGLIKVGEDLFALSVAHSLWASSQDALAPDSVLSLFCGNIKWAQWSKNQEALLASSKSERSQDWMTIEPDTKWYLPNEFVAEGISDPIPVHETLNTQDILDGDVWVCGGFSGVQAGWISTTPATIIYDKAEYSVLSIALIRPLSAGDSGSWVIQNNKLCGYILARLNNKLWAYMLPVQTVFDDIETYAFQTTGSRVKVTLPTASEVQIARARQYNETAQVRPIVQDNTTVQLLEPQLDGTKLKLGDQAFTTSPYFQVKEGIEGEISLALNAQPSQMLESNLVEFKANFADQISATHHYPQLKEGIEGDTIPAQKKQPIDGASRDSLEISAAPRRGAGDDMGLFGHGRGDYWGAREPRSEKTSEPTERFDPYGFFKGPILDSKVEQPPPPNTAGPSKKHLTYDPGSEPESGRTPDKSRTVLEIISNIPKRYLKGPMRWIGGHKGWLLVSLLVVCICLAIVLVLVLIVLPRTSSPTGFLLQKESQDT